MPASEKYGIFRKNDSIGAAGAEEDKMLQACFIDTGDFDYLADPDDHRRIVLGRTGTGKSALFERLKWEHGDSVITIVPENLALSYISNSTILDYFMSLGVNLDPFFKLLWRHVFTVEILLRHFDLPSSKERKTLFTRIKGFITGNNSRSDQEIEAGIKYLEDWGKKYWEQTETRVREITSTMESRLANEVSAQLSIPPAKVGAALQEGRKLTEEQKSQLKQRGQTVVSDAQIESLNKVTKLLDHMLAKASRNYYLVVDRLDENWAEARLRRRLIRTLIDTVKDFVIVKHVKLMIALRRDLIERVFRLTQDSGFQKEKYESLYLHLHWDKKHLIELLDKRINALVSNRVFKTQSTHADFLPKKYHGQKIGDFICDVARRPRDIIDFFNCCILSALSAAHRRKLNATALGDAEGQYSTSRFQALGDEWSADYSRLLNFSKILVHRTEEFLIGNVSPKEIEDFALEISVRIKVVKNASFLEKCAYKVVDDVIPPNEFRHHLFHVFYHVGLVGLKLSHDGRPYWSDVPGTTVLPGQIEPSTVIVIHPAYRKALCINRGSQKRKR
jgi:hypothetical protein